MTNVLLLHHAQGLTPGVLAFADALRDAGHTVHTPDSYDGHTFDDLDAGIAYASEVGFGVIMQRGVDAAVDLPPDTVYLGISMGVMAAQQLAQTRPGAAGGVFIASCLPVAEFGGWPDGVPVQVHGKDADPIFVDEGDLEAAQELVTAVEGAELFLYPGDQHLFLDSSLPAFDPEATAALTARVLAFLAAAGVADQRATPRLAARAKIYYKYEGVSPVGSHKANTAVAQAYYNAAEGITKLTTETGAGQWGAALSFASALLGLTCEVWQVRASYDSKPYRRMQMETYGSICHPSPSDLTNAGRAMLAADPETTGSLGMAISEAVEAAATNPEAHYALGSVLNHVLLHQSVIGQEALAQLDEIGEGADIVFGCAPTRLRPAPPGRGRGPQCWPQRVETGALVLGLTVAVSFGTNVAV